MSTGLVSVLLNVSNILWCMTSFRIYLVDLSWTGDAKRPIKAEHLTLLLASYLHTSKNVLSSIEFVILEVLPEFVSKAGADVEDDEVSIAP